MGELDQLVRDMVVVAKEFVSDFLVEVYHIPATGHTDMGPVYGNEIPRQAIWEDKFQEIPGSGEIASGKLTFLESIPITSYDRFRLPTMAAGESAPVAGPEGMRDPDSLFYVVEVYLGK